MKPDVLLCKFSLYPRLKLANKNARFCLSSVLFLRIISEFGSHSILGSLSYDELSRNLCLTMNFLVTFVLP